MDTFSYTTVYGQTVQEVVDRVNGMEGRKRIAFMSTEGEKQCMRFAAVVEIPQINLSKAFARKG
jgi:hypothetical protein